jgi:hypothetical protein
MRRGELVETNLTFFTRSAAVSSRPAAAFPHNTERSTWLRAAADASHTAAVRIMRTALAQ